MIKKYDLEIVKIKDIKTDSLNPNKMNERTFEALKKLLKKYGNLGPVVINKDGLLVNGEQRYNAYIELGEKEIPAIRIDVTEVDRIILRQTLNKVHGEHDKSMDVEEYKFILQNTSMDEFTSLMAIPEQEILNAFERANNKDLISEVDRTHERLMTCPKCGVEFKKGQ